MLLPLTEMLLTEETLLVALIQKTYKSKFAFDMFELLKIQLWSNVNFCAKFHVNLSKNW